MKFIFAYLKKYRFQALLAPLLKMLEAILDLLVPLIMAMIINTGIVNQDRTYIYKYSFLLVILGLLGLAISIIAQYFAAKAACQTTGDLRASLFSKIQTLSYSQLDKLGTSSLINRCTTDLNQIQNGLNLFLRLFLRSPFIVFGSIVMAFIVSSKGGLVLLVILPFLTLIVFAIMLKSLPLYQKIQAYLDNLTSRVRQELTGIKVIRGFGKEAKETEQFSQETSKLKDSQEAVGKLSALMNPLTLVIIDLGIIVLLQVSGIQVNIGALNQGEVIALVSYLNSILVELIKLANLIIQLTKALACSKRVEEILELPEQQSCGKEALIDNNSPLIFDNVSLSYSGFPALTNISFKLPPGNSLGIIGGTGAGKSSLVSLLPRYYDHEGQILLFGKELNTYDLNQLRKDVLVVPQNNTLFSGTVRSNLLLGNLTATDEELRKALKIAQADFILSSSSGLDCEVKPNGLNYSGGQRQRLCIARALVAKPKILILDDSTSALDYGTDAKLRSELNKLKLTLIIVSQRCNSIKDCDQILVLDQGNLIDQGTHEKLMNTSQIYAQIYQSQIGKELTNA